MRLELGLGGLCVGLLALARVLGGAVAPQLKAPAGLTQHQQEELEESAVASLFGEFRTTMADFLWLEADRYLHGGVTTRGMLASEQKDSSVGKVTGTQEIDHHTNETTVVPSKASDWRSMLGDIERETQPYQDMEHHREKDPKETLPLFRAMTLANPHFVQGYVQGAARMVALPGKQQEAIDFLQEGARNNPESIDVQTTLCEQYFYYLKKPLEAEPYGQRALALARARDKASLSEDEREAFVHAYRWLILIYRNTGDDLARQGQRQKAHQVFAAGRALSQECLTHFADDPTAHRYLREYAGR